jgi:triacylglycerol lipase
MSNLKFIFVHGLSGWGSYDSRYRKIPYWGMRGGDLIVFLKKNGFDCYAASVAPTGSAWDRACELYAQIAGTQTDYGASHSQRYGHERFGRDFSGHPLLPEWTEETRLVLLGHSFGGATVRLFAELLAHGDVGEQAGSDSPLFKGGMADRIHSIVALASPMNGTTAYDLFSDPSFHPELTPVPWWSKGLSRLMSMGTKPKRDNRSAQDYADYDMHIDHALALNRRTQPLASVYYYSVPCSFTAKQPDGTHRPKRGMEPLFVMRSCQIGAYTGKTASGTSIDETWRENDGLVNTVSATAPLGQPHVPLDRLHVEPGIWNVFPTLNGDHMFLQGGLSRRHSIRPFYLDLLTLITAQEHRISD